MSHPVRAYACDWKCGRQVATSKKRVEEHEKHCFYNPVRRACVTCGNFIKSVREHGGGDEEGHGYFPYYEPQCCAVREDVELDKKLQHDCPSWAGIPPSTDTPNQEPK